MSDKKKILVVDDEPDIVTWLTTIFDEGGYDTISAKSGAEGFSKALSEKPDMITLDISMDDESGLKALRKFQENSETANIPIIIITGVSPDVKRFIDRNKKIQMPASFMEKPIDREELLAKTKELIG
jgi:DNA-binding response OmpR family regulator